MEMTSKERDVLQQLLKDRARSHWRGLLSPDKLRERAAVMLRDDFEFSPEESRALLDKLEI